MIPLTDLTGTLRQILAVLECERQALAGLDLEAILGCASRKSELCGHMEILSAEPGLSDELRGLIEAAKRRNEVNRQMRNLIAANVAARLESLTGAVPLYAAGPSAAVPAGVRC